MKSSDFSMIASLLCKKSSDCRANEKECSDSAGNRWRSSITGDAGPPAKNCAVEADRDEVPETGSVEACCSGGAVKSDSS